MPADADAHKPLFITARFAIARHLATPHSTRPFQGRALQEVESRTPHAFRSAPPYAMLDRQKRTLLDSHGKGVRGRRALRRRKEAARLAKIANVLDQYTDRPAHRTTAAASPTKKKKAKTGKAPPRPLPAPRELDPVGVLQELRRIPADANPLTSGQLLDVLHDNEELALAVRELLAGVEERDPRELWAEGERLRFLAARCIQARWRGALARMRQQRMPRVEVICPCDACEAAAALEEASLSAVDSEASSEAQAETQAQAQAHAQTSKTPTKANNKHGNGRLHHRPGETPLFMTARFNIRKHMATDASRRPFQGTVVRDLVQPFEAAMPYITLHRQRRTLLDSQPERLRGLRRRAQRRAQRQGASDRSWRVSGARPVHRRPDRIVVDNDAEMLTQLKQAAAVVAEKPPPALTSAASPVVAAAIAGGESLREVGGGGGGGGETWALTEVPDGMALVQAPDGFQLVPADAVPADASPVKLPPGFVLSFENPDAAAAFSLSKESSVVPRDLFGSWSSASASSASASASASARSTSHGQLLQLIEEKRRGVRG